MKLIFRNLRCFIMGHPCFFLLTVLCVAFSSVLMLFGYGAYQNYQLEKVEIERNTKQIEFLHDPDSHSTYSETFFMDESHIITKAEFDACLQNISQETHNDIEVIGAWICSSTDPYSPIWPFRTGFYIHDGQYHIKDDYFDGVMQFPGSIGRNFTEEEYASGAAVAIVAVGSAPQVITETYYDANGNVIGHKVERGDKYKIGDTLVFDNKEYEIIAIAGGNTQMSYPSLPDTTYIADFSVEFTLPPTASQYQEILEAFAPLMDRVSISDYVPFYTEDFWLYNTIMLVAVLIAVVAAFNLVVLYQYILMKRQKALAVLQICGCTKWRAIFTYCLESILITIPSYWLSAAGFHYLLLPLLKKPFPFIRTAYSLKLYGLGFAIMVSVCAVAMFLLSSYIVRKHSIVERKGGVE